MPLFHGWTNDSKRVNLHWISISSVIIMYKKAAMLKMRKHVRCFAFFKKSALTISLNQLVKVMETRIRPTLQIASLAILRPKTITVGVLTISTTRITTIIILRVHLSTVVKKGHRSQIISILNLPL